MKTKLSYVEIHDVVDRSIKHKWDGWVAVFFDPDPSFYMKRSGSFCSGEWGKEIRVAPDSDGFWRVPERLLNG